MTDRRPAAVLFTDMAGYSTLTQRDEPLTLRLLDEQRELVRSFLGRFGGREIKTLGDGFLVEFDDAAPACRCAWELQRALDERNHRPDVAPIHLRIGIHFGEVLHREGDVFGDAVNTASRIHGLAEPGGICVSGIVLDRVRGTLPYETIPLRPGLRGLVSSPELYRLELPWLRTIRELAGAQGPPSADGLAREVPLVDRKELLTEIQGFVERIAGMEGSTLLLAGEPGIGKHRLILEAVDYARRWGVRTLLVRCSEVEGTGPLAPWTELFSRIVREDTRATLLRYVGTYGAELVRLFPGIAEKLGPLEQLPAGEPSAERLRFFDATAEFFRRASQDAPLLLVLADLGAADPDSLELLRYLVGRFRGGRIGVLASYADPGAASPSALRELLGHLHEDRLAVTRRLERFDLARTSELVRHLLGGGGRELPERLVDTVYAKTGGNPYFAEEVVRDLVAGGLLVADGEDGWQLRPGVRLRLPPTVRELLTRRLRRLSEPTRELVRAASVLGAEFDLEVLRRMLEISSETLVEGLEEALGTGVLGEERRRVGRTLGSFQDDLVWEAVYDDLSSPRRRLLHGRAARALEATYGRTPQPHVGEIARHHLDAGDPEQGPRWALEAAREARRLFAYEQAAQILGRAYELTSPDADPRVRARLLEELAETLLAQGRLRPSIDHLREAAHLWGSVGETRHAGGLLARVAGALWLFTNEEAAYDPAFEEARAALAADPRNPQLAALLAQAAIVYPWLGRPERGRQLAEEALDLTRTSTMPEVERRAHLALCLATPIAERDAGLGHLAAWNALATASTADGLLAFPADEFVTAAKTEFSARGDWRSAVRPLEEARESARSARLFEQVAYLQINLSEFYFEAGAADAGQRASDEVEQLVREHGFGSESSQHFLDLITANRGLHTGRLDEARVRMVRTVEGLEKACPQYLGLIGFYGLLGELEVQADQPSRARVHLERCRHLARSSGYPLNQAYRILPALSVLVGVHLAQGEEDAARKVLDELRTLADELDHPVARGFAVHAEGDLAASRSDWSGASHAYDTALRAWSGADWNYWSEVARLDLGRARGALGDRDGALEALTTASRRFREMGRSDGVGRAERARAALD